MGAAPGAAPTRLEDLNIVYWESRERFWENPYIFGKTRASVS
jgi:hypothetical protein